jgi:branched-chain amino acid transport system ATP-binding protein
VNESPSLLTIEGLHAGYGDQAVLHGVDLTLRRGESVAVIGPNGAGKSTLLNTISGIVPSRGGRVRLEGQDLTGKHPHHIVDAGVVQVPEGRQVFPEMSVADNLMMGAYAKRSGASERLDAVLETFPRLKDRIKQDAQTLSGGEQQMLAIGRGLMADPTVLLLDEPTLGLAPILVDVVLDRLRTVRDAFGTSMVVVEQNAYLARELCDRYVVLHQGRVTRTGEQMPEDAQELMDAFLGPA